MVVRYSDIDNILRSDYEDEDEELRDCTNIILTDGTSFDVRGKIESKMLRLLGIKRKRANRWKAETFTDALKMAFFMHDGLAFDVDDEVAVDVMTAKAWERKDKE